VALLADFAEQKRSFVTAQTLSSRRAFERTIASGLHEASITELTLNDFNRDWADVEGRLRAIPGKEALSAFNARLQNTYRINVTSTSIIEAMLESEIPTDMRDLLIGISSFAAKRVER
jgi:hypothetical protein